MKKPVRPAPRPLRKIDVVHKHRQAMGELAHFARARLPPRHTLLAEIEALQKTLQASTTCVFRLYTKGSHLFFAANADPGPAPAFMGNVLVEHMFTLMPTSTTAALNQLHVQIAGAYGRAQKDALQEVGRTRIPPAMQKR